ncbi:amino acid/amide ABC transporter substrate-binding protein, HAAT family [Ectothiorhodosinus mongolicus]|uniref:Amino acid/amide ABC transporter substrate-binding protein, HAAT family n=1 Tax=Ectothiorhodosinus mongolicus TaxID=233100 RepID=A0A1R3W593_9GAMM|nr:transporter substrate-binding domain-containing protein [Ectothiorhodosinus mongolicus]ULX57561.1 ABC transporter substrate-binding protein [Ectothiorhodosinus mongolicus]SIT72805.1 amino acid/amide ABC transporter substrate-binding protein, HAAT family [Ectothiorhodosinus mongolicus]
MKRRDFLKGVSAFGVAGAAGFPGIWTQRHSAWAQGSDIPVGVLFSVTGAVAVVESTLRDACLMAIEEINNNGGVNGRRLRPVIEDPASDPATFADRIRRLVIRDRCVSVFGGYTSASRQAVLPVVEQRENLFWYPTLYEGRECSRNVMYGGAVPNQQQQDFVPWLAENFGKRFYLIGNDYVYPREENNVVRLILSRLGGEAVNEEYVPLGHSEFSSVISRIRRANPDVIFCTLVGDSDVAFQRQMHAAGFDPQRMPVASLTRSEIEVKAIGGEAAAGHFSSAPYFMGHQSAENQAFVEAYLRRYGADQVTHFVNEAAYFQVYQFAAALEKLAPSDITPNNIRDAAVGMRMMAPQGEIEIDPNLHTHVWPKVAQWQADGTAKVVLESTERMAPEPYWAYEGMQCTGAGLVRS